MFGRSKHRKRLHPHDRIWKVDTGVTKVFLWSTTDFPHPPFSPPPFLSLLSLPHPFRVVLEPLSPLPFSPAAAHSVTFEAQLLIWSCLARALTCQEGRAIKQTGKQADADPLASPVTARMIGCGSQGDREETRRWWWYNQGKKKCWKNKRCSSLLPSHPRTLPPTLPFPPFPRTLAYPFPLMSSPPLSATSSPPPPLSLWNAYAHYLFASLLGVLGEIYMHIFFSQEFVFIRYISFVYVRSLKNEVVLTCGWWVDREERPGWGDTSCAPEAFLRARILIHEFSLQRTPSTGFLWKISSIFSFPMVQVNKLYIF